MAELVKKEILSEEEIGRLIEFAKEAGGIEYAYQTMERLRNEACAILNTFPESQTVKDFRDLFAYIIARKG